MKVHVLSILTFTVTRGLACCTEWTPPRTEYFLKWSVHSIPTRHRRRPSFLYRVRTRVSAVRDGTLHSQAPSREPVHSLMWSSVQEGVGPGPPPRFAEVSPDLTGLAWGLRLVRTGRKRLEPNGSAPKPFFSYDHSVPAPGLHCHSVSTIPCPTGIVFFSEIGALTNQAIFCRTNSTFWRQDMGPDLRT